MRTTHTERTTAARSPASLHHDASTSQLCLPAVLTGTCCTASCLHRRHVCASFKQAQRTAGRHPAPAASLPWQRNQAAGSLRLRNVQVIPMLSGDATEQTPRPAIVFLFFKGADRLPGAFLRFLLSTCYSEADSLSRPFVFDVRVANSPLEPGHLAANVFVVTLRHTLA
jgi:hypothetical protein